MSNDVILLGFILVLCLVSFVVEKNRINMKYSILIGAVTGVVFELTFLLLGKVGLLNVDNEFSFWWVLFWVVLCSVVTSFPNIKRVILEKVG